MIFCVNEEGQIRTLNWVNKKDWSALMDVRPSTFIILKRYGYCFIDKTFDYLEYKLWYNIVGYIYRKKVNVGGYYEYNMVNLCTENRNPL